jgi:homoserine O-succinyltransferase
MPDGAFEDTERQFLELLDAASGCETVAVTRYALAGVPRGERIEARIAEQYRPVADMKTDPPDLLVLTGANPVEDHLTDEPHWAELADLLTWSTTSVSSVLLSCLSAHAGLAVFDGVDRGRLDAKCTGVFLQEVVAGHPLVDGLTGPVVLPHSRLNDIPEATVVGAGYRVALRNRDGGWSVADRTVGRARVVLVQGHPEYDPSSLLREYQRDARRYVTGERDDLPRLPEQCTTGVDWDRLRTLQQRLVDGERRPDLVESFPFDEVGARASWPWRTPATKLYANWLAGVPQRSE